MRLAPPLAFLLCLGFAAANAAPIPPAQPATGPGGADYAYARVASHASGDDGDDVTVFWPEQPAAAQPLPVIVFAHGWGATKPEHYLAWIHHLVRHGAIVLYPRYQKNLRTPPAEFTPNAVAGVKRGLDWLARQKDLPRADLARLATVGHSAGGVLAANLAVALPAAGLPAPKAVMCVEPAVLERDQGPLVPLADLAQVPAATLLLTLSGDRDTLVGDTGARRIYEATTAVPAAQKDWLELRSDDHGAPALVATHRAPAAPLPGYQPPQREEPKGFIRKRLAEKAKERLAERGLNLDDSSHETPVTDALDYYGTWRLFDALRAAAFENRLRDVALGGGPTQLAMGQWSDGTPVKPLLRRGVPPAQ
ncbi:alpha/beta hydrolase family protein [Oleiharenicola sp. Vm1]|uniref:alpha/beta hydrolase family protein n=1 Tax=Oleiharenicola sp. Vm1 TaxID=3398393 RepID=UPI0039F4BF22